MVYEGDRGVLGRGVPGGWSDGLREGGFECGVQEVSRPAGRWGFSAAVSG